MSKSCLAQASGLDFGIYWEDLANMSSRSSSPGLHVPRLSLSPSMVNFLHQPQGPLLSHWVHSFCLILELQGDRCVPSLGRHAICSLVSHSENPKWALNSRTNTCGSH